MGIARARRDGVGDTVQIIHGIPGFFLVEPILINPLKKVPVVKTKLLQIIYSPPSKITPEIL